MKARHFLKELVIYSIIILSVACSGGPKKVPNTTHNPRLTKTGKTFDGNASWYGRQFQGNKTASGERFNMHALTAAHKKLPFNTYLEVTNLDNNKKIIVRVNDRGPFIKNRVLDLSQKAAQELGFQEKGTTKIKVEILKPAS